MRVVVLGHRGFVGSAVATHLSSLGHDVAGVDRSNYASLCGPADVVINANGSSDKRLADSDPLASFRANVDATLASIVDFPCELYVHLSTISVYTDLGDPSRNRESADIDLPSLPPYGLHKLLAESLVRKHAARWLILRLGNLVGPRLRKNPVYDLLERGRLFVHPDSTLSFLDTRDVARIAWGLRHETNDIFNLCGNGAVRLSDLARELGVTLDESLRALPIETQDINIDKLRAQTEVPDSATTVIGFCQAWRAGKLRTIA